MLIDHIPVGNPCETCGESAFSHRIEHKPDGDPCKICGLHVSQHRVRKRYQESKNRTIFLGIDGEGKGRKVHKYVLLAAVTEDGDRKWWVEDQNGLSTERCLDFLLNLPQHNTKAFAYAFGYDMTKILQDVDDKILYQLFRPELRHRNGKEAMKGPRPVKWRGYKLNLQGTKFTIAKDGRYRVIWDIWKFFQSSFVNALIDWKVADLEKLERMAYMKAHRHEFDKLDDNAIRDYCIEECEYMGRLARKLVTAHEQAGLTLRAFYGAGSTAAAMLTKMGIKDKIKPAPKNMQIPVAQAFFGGRFENSVIGEFKEPIYNYDISSAYPYQLCFLPCLLHGEWEYTTNREDIDGVNVRASLIHYTLGPSTREDWGPFPFRTQDGSITFPVESGGGWVWDEEYKTGERMFDNVRFIEAWVYKSVCGCQPFKDIPQYYLERLGIGKEGPGIVIKLGMNSNYGKLAQSIGKGQFNCWVWAGLVTSRTRAQLLDAIDTATDRGNIYMLATDGIFSRERLTLAKPKDTGTDIEVLDRSTGKIKYAPLGGWEENIIPQGIFIARPGIYFPLNPTEKDLKKIKARGLGKASLYENHKKILEHWDTYGHHMKVEVSNVSRFCGAKSSISRSGPTSQFSYNRATRHDDAAHGERRSANAASGAQKDVPAYGQWITRPVEMSFDPMPKRENVNKDGRTLKIRRLPSEMESMPYKKAVKSLDRVLIEQIAAIMLEQPDADLADYPVEDV